MYLEDIYTIAVNLAGLPAASIPVGVANGIAHGHANYRRLLRRSEILNVAHQFQQHTDWHKQKPGPIASSEGEA